MTLPSAGFARSAAEESHITALLTAHGAPKPRRRVTDVGEAAKQRTWEGPLLGHRPVHHDRPMDETLAAVPQSPARRSTSGGAAADVSKPWGRTTLPTHHQPRWVHSSGGLAVVLGMRADPVPDELVAHLEQGTTADPAEDLIELEGKLRATVATLTRRANQAEHAVADARRLVADAKTDRGLSAWLRRRRTKADLAGVITAQSKVRDLLDDAVAMRDVLREFVIRLDAPSGLLRESADGWQHSPDVPPSVVVFGPEDSFVAADSRRLEAGWGGSRIAGVVYGEQWRRDGDDDGPYSQPLDRAGPWRVAFIPRTGEIYASRRCGYLSQEVWLLGSDFEPDHAHDLLTGLMPRMREPNSVILAAGVVHATRSLRPRGRCVALRRPPARLSAPTGEVDEEDTFVSD